MPDSAHQSLDPVAATTSSTDATAIGDSRSVVVDGLARLLADTYTLMLQTHRYHWNVTGPMFQSLHSMFQTQYEELFLAADLIAERIRALGAYAPGSYRQFALLTSIDDGGQGDVVQDKDGRDEGGWGDDERIGSIEALEMVRRLVVGHETTARTARALFPTVEGRTDQPTADLLTRRLEVHEKTAWMLRSLLA